MIDLADAAIVAFGALGAGLLLGSYGRDSYWINRAANGYRAYARGRMFTVREVVLEAKP